MRNSFADYRGKTIQKGTRVAYNQSGDVVIGFVLSVEVKPIKNDRWNRNEYLIRVAKKGGEVQNEISKVRNHRCIVSIE